MYATKLGVESQCALLRHDEHFSIGVVEKSPLHRAVGGK